MNKKILIVDNEDHILTLIKFNLERNGFNVVTASNGVEALLKVKNNKPDLIILDVMLPILDGIEVCKVLWIKKKRNTYFNAYSKK